MCQAQCTAGVLGLRGDRCRGGGGGTAHQEVRRVLRRLSRIIGGDPSAGKRFFQNSVALDIWKPWTRRPGQTTPPEDSCADVASTSFSIWTTLWLNRKFRTP